MITNELHVGVFRLSEHFMSAEFECHHCHVLKVNPALVNLVEAIRVKVGRPVLVDCGYRCPEHNAAIGGVPHSQHLLGNAADIRVTGLTAASLYAIVRDTPGLGGVGVDEHKGYVHVDCRPLPEGKRVAKWCYDIHGKECAWDIALNLID